MNLADKTVLNILAKSSQAVLLLISSIVMVRYFTKSEYGTFLQIMLISNTVIMFTFVGLPQSIYYYYQRVLNQRSFIVRNVILSITIAFIAAVIVYVLKNPLADWLNNPLMAEYGGMISLVVFFRAPSLFSEPILISHRSLILNSASTLLWNILFFGPIITATLFSVSLSFLIKIIIISCGLQFVIYLGLMTWVFFHTQDIASNVPDDNVSKERVSFKSQIIYSLPLAISSYIGTIGKQIDQYIVSGYFTPKDFAVYSRGAMNIPFLSTIYFTINDIMTPKYIQAYRTGNTKAFLNNFHVCIEKVAKINYPIFALLFAIAPLIITFLYTDDYVGATSIFRVYLCFLLSRITVYGIVPRASGKTSSIMHVSLLSLSLNVIFSLLLISRIGPIGAALATVVSVLITQGYYLYLSCNILGVSFGQIFPWKYLFQLLLLSLVASLPVYCINYFFHTRVGNVFLLLLVDGIVYAYCWIFLAMRREVIYQDDMELLQKWLRFDVKRLLYKITFLA